MSHGLLDKGAIEHLLDRSIMMELGAYVRVRACACVRACTIGNDPLLRSIYANMCSAGLAVNRYAAAAQAGGRHSKRPAG